MARDACVKDRQRTAELAGFLRATVPTVPRPHLKTGQRLHEIATCEKRSDPMCEGPNSWHRRETSDARNTEPTQRCSTGSTTFTDITSFTSFTNITNIASTTIPSKKTKIDSTSYPHSGKFLSLVSEKFRRVIGLVRELPVSNRNKEKVLLDSSAILSPKSLGIRNQQTSHTVNTKSSLLHGAFDIPQQYYLRDKLESNGGKHVFSGEMRECENDTSLCDHTSTDYHRGSCKMLSLTRRYFILDNTGEVRQYALTISDEPAAEKVFQIHANSIVVATDAIPEHIWCLRLSNYDIHDAHLQELPHMECEISSGPEKAPSKLTEDMLIVFNNAENFATWMFAIKELVEKHKKRSRFSFLGQRHNFSLLSGSQDRGSPLVTEERRSSCDDEHAHPFATELHRICYPFDTNVDSPVSRYELAPEVHGRADRVVLVSGDKHKSIEDSSVHTVVESSTMGAHLSTTSEDEDSCNTSIQHFQMGHRTSLESVIPHSLFELPVESQTADSTGDGQSVNSDDVISHSLFERHPSVVEDHSSRCYHLFPSADAKDLSESDSKNLFELSPPLHGTKVARSVCEHEIDLTLRPTLSWTVDEEDSTCRTLTVAPSCPPNSPRNSDELQSLAGVSTRDFPLPSIYGQLGSDNISHRIDPGSMGTLLRISREQAPRNSESEYKKSPTEFARAKHSCESPFFRPGRHVHPPRHSHTDSLRTTSCPILHVSLPTAP